MRIEHAVASLPANGSGPVFLLLHGWGRTSMTFRDCWIIVRPAPITRRCVRRFRTARATRGSAHGITKRPDRRIARSAITPSRRGHRRMGGRQHRPGAPHRGHGLLPRRSTRRRDAARQPETVRRRSQFLRLPRTWRVAWRRRACATEPPMFYGHGSADDIFPKSELDAMNAFYASHTTLTEKIYPA